MKIALGIHVSEAVLPKIYFNHLSTVAVWAKKHDLVLAGTERTKVASARNKIVDAAVKQECSHVLFLDADHIVPDNMLDLLVENADAAMVSGLVCKRLFPFDTVAFKFLPGDELEQIVIAERGRVLEVDACAMGCTLVNLEEIKKLRKPYFVDRSMRSDLNLCVAFRKAGCKVLIDTRIGIGHLGEAPVITPENADEIREQYINVVLKDKDGKISD